eukprot:420306-Pleurochrysis_carterae.AAC.1
MPVRPHHMPVRRRRLRGLRRSHQPDPMHSHRTTELRSVGEKQDLVFTCSASAARSAKRLSTGTRECASASSGERVMFEAKRPSKSGA